MPDGTSTWGTDTSRYQPIGTYNPEHFEIVNIEDPGWLGKWHRNRAEGRPTGFYLWVYPGHDLAADTRWAIDMIRGVGIGDPELGLWADYEEAGVEQWQMDQFRATAQHMAMKAGRYHNPHSLNHQAFADLPWWSCVYPGNNDGSFPGYGALWSSSRPWPEALWQYTSTANGPVGLDRNVVVDDAWYAAFLGGSIMKEWDEMATRDEIKEVVREVLNEGTAQGTVSWAETMRTVLGGIQNLFNVANAGEAQDREGVQRILDAVADPSVTVDVDELAQKLAGLLGMPTGGLSAANRAEITSGTTAAREALERVDRAVAEA